MLIFLLVSLLFVAEINPYSFFKFKIFCDFSINKLISRNQALQVLATYIVQWRNDTMATCEGGNIGNSKHKCTLTGSFVVLQ